ncbi:MAG: hypothetical protein LBD72_01045 [Puniceicoccales bacterium]|nr:hypothetical protein [Puniceicoccales bacterium]
MPAEIWSALDKSLKGNALAKAQEAAAGKVAVALFSQPAVAEAPIYIVRSENHVATRPKRSVGIARAEIKLCLVVTLHRKCFAHPTSSRNRLNQR